MYLYRGPEKIVLDEDGTIEPDTSPRRFAYQRIKSELFTSSLFDDPSPRLDTLKQVLRQKYLPQDLGIIDDPFLIHNLLLVDLSTVGELTVRVIKYIDTLEDLMDEVKQMGYLPLDEIESYSGESKFVVDDTTIMVIPDATSMKFVQIEELLDPFYTRRARNGRLFDRRETRNKILATTRDHRLHLIEFHVTGVQRQDITEMFGSYKIARIEAPDSKLILLLTDQNTIITGVINNVYSRYFFNMREIQTFPSTRFGDITFYDTYTLHSIRRIISDTGNVPTALKLNGQMIVAGSDSSTSENLDAFVGGLKPVDFGGYYDYGVMMKNEDGYFYLFDTNDNSLTEEPEIPTDLTFDPFRERRVIKSARR